MKKLILVITAVMILTTIKAHAQLPSVPVSGSVAQQEIIQLYEDILGREPDLGGLSGWTNARLAGMSLDDIRFRFANSDEAAAKIKDLAVNILGRDPNSLSPADALAWWGEPLRDGGKLSDIRAMFAGSLEAGIHLRDLAIKRLGRDPLQISPEQASTYWSSLLLTYNLTQVENIFTYSTEGHAYSLSKKKHK